MTIDLATASAAELENELVELVHSWCGNDDFAQQPEEQQKAAAILWALEQRFGIRKKIIRAPGIIGFYVPVYADSAAESAPPPIIH